MDAKKIFQDFSGKEHEVVTGFAIIDTKNNMVINDVGTAKVKFRDLSEDEIDNYIATGEPMIRAGVRRLERQ